MSKTITLTCPDCRQPITGDPAIVMARYHLRNPRKVIAPMAPGLSPIENHEIPKLSDTRAWFDIIRQHEHKQANVCGWIFDLMVWGSNEIDPKLPPSLMIELGWIPEETETLMHAFLRSARATGVPKHQLVTIITRAIMAD